MFSKACEYGIKAIIYIATQSLKNERVKIGDIAKNTDSPEAFTAKVLGSLVKRNIVKSQTGPNGGFYIDIDQMKHIPISDIVIAIDGENLFKGCALGLRECNEEKPCPLHHKFIEIRTSLKLAMETTNVYELTKEVQEGAAVFLK